MSTLTPERTAAAPEQRPTPELPVAPAAVVEAPAVPVADPGPLGLAGFALTTFVLCVFNAGLVDVRLEPVVLPIALFYGGIAQLLAGMWEFRKNNTFGAVAFTSYGAFWLSFAAYAKFIAPGLPAGQAYVATGLFLLAWTIFTAYMTIAALRTNGVIATVFVVLLATFALLTVGELVQNTTIFRIGGWAGILTALLAWYGSAAVVVNSTWGRPVLPVFPIKK
jgi:succinate-acetate transporter protein